MISRLSKPWLVLVAFAVIASTPVGAQTNLSPTAQQIAEAMDVPAAAIVSSQLVESPGDAARGVVAAFGSELVPRAGDNMVVLSSGTARAPSMPGYASPVGTGTQWGTGPFALPILQPNLPGCDAPGEPMDLTELRIDLIAPAGVTGFSFDHNFFAADYPEWVCDSPFSDAFIALVESPSLGPLNVAFDSNGNPITLHTAQFLAGEGAPLGTAALNGTGYETGGATMWNTASVPAAPGEAITLRFFIYDANDGQGDSLVLLDNFQWILPATGTPVAHAGADQTVPTLSGTATVTLNGTGSSDPEGGELTYSWTWASGSASGPTPAVTLPVGTHLITLTVADPIGAAATDTVTVTVVDGTPSLNDTIAGLLGSVALHDTSIASHDASIGALQATVAALQSTITALQSTVAALQASLEAQGVRLAGAESRAAALEAQVITLQNALDGVLNHPIWNSVPNAGGRGGR